MEWSGGWRMKTALPLPVSQPPRALRPPRTTEWNTYWAVRGFCRSTKFNQPKHLWASKQVPLTSGRVRANERLGAAIYPNKLGNVKVPSRRNERGIEKERAQTVGVYFETAPTWRLSHTEDWASTDPESALSHGGQRAAGTCRFLEEKKPCWALLHKLQQMFEIRPDIISKVDASTQIRGESQIQKRKWTFTPLSVRKYIDHVLFYSYGFINSDKRGRYFLLYPSSFQDGSSLTSPTFSRWGQVRFPPAHTHTFVREDSIWERNRRMQTERFMTLLLWSRALNDPGCLVNVRIHLRATCQSPDRSEDASFMSAVNKMSWKQDVARGSAGPPTARLTKANRAFTLRSGQMPVAGETKINLTWSCSFKFAVAPHALTSIRT